ncbi:SulP family inorganic anion transporter [Altericroceibacterium spongiae]|uniref:SulP family inorganic anion transporter n=1 Tax=Altericroceibacterium spongiae TaxID=2320269 RepID=A0A420EC84_9SPHN|nr:SulP family inorganic anion transporter [Altericroceibacterium spongiae]RKF18286.1 SulP family inorganic anion transporter [Altericroceibacterium spongiae]
MAATDISSTEQTKGTFGRDFAASFVVFLVAMPLCLGIAIASGVPPELGLVTGIIGGIVVGCFAGSPLQVSGPAAGLAVLVFDMVQRHGLVALGPVLLLAGILQFAGGALRLGQFFRGVSPAVIHGMLAGIGAMIVLQQIHVMLDDSPRSDGLANLAAIPGAFMGLNDDAVAALAVGVVTIAAMMGWDRFKPSPLKMIPGALVGVVAGTVLAMGGDLAIQRIELPDNIASGLTLTSMESLSMLSDPALIGLAFAFAFIASAETLLSAAAVDRMQDRVQSRFNKELSAQGIGNFLCGLVGALPMTGVIVRSSANVQAGAMTRLSTILHGVWILAFVVLLPFILAEVPTAALGGVLVITGIKLVKLRDVQHLFTHYGVLPALIWAVTFTLVVTVDLLTGVLAGLAMTLIELLPQFRRMRLNIEERQHGEGDHEVALEGKATAMAIHKVAGLLDRLPNSGRLKLNLSRLEFVDHTTSELFCEALTRRKQKGMDIEVEQGGHGRHQRIANAVN